MGYYNNCRTLSNEVRTLINDINNDTALLNRKYAELENNGCIRDYSWDYPDYWYPHCRRCCRHCCRHCCRCCCRYY